MCIYVVIKSTFIFRHKFLWLIGMKFKKSKLTVH